MILGGLDLKCAFRDGGPWKAYRNGTRIYRDDLKIGPNSIDVTLNNTFLTMKDVTGGVIDPHKDNIVWQKSVIEGDDQFVLYPREVALAAVNERFECDRIILDAGSYFVPMIEGRSTLARCGLAVHATAGFGDYGFSGAFTLELHNVSNYPIALKPGMRIAQVYFTSVFRPLEYKGAYATNHNDGPVPPKLGEGRF